MQKIPMTAIDQIQRELQNAPECPVAEISKVRAVRLLAPQIHSMQSKGYSLVAIAAMLTDKGLAVTASALKSYLYVAKEDRAMGRKKPSRRMRDSAPNHPADRTRPVTRIDTEAPHEAPAAPKASDSKVASASDVAPKPQSPAASPSAPPTTGQKAVAPRTPEVAPRRSAFMPSKDSEDI
jgi:hypothetical protein